MMLVATGKIFRFDTSLRHAGYILSVISAISAAALLSNSLPYALPSPLQFCLSLLGVIPVIVVFLIFAVGLYVWVRSMMIRWRLHDPFQDLLPVIHVQAFPNVQHVHAHQMPQARGRTTGGDSLNISEVGREQISRLIKADGESVTRRSKNSKYVFVSGRRKWSKDSVRAIKEATGFDLESW